MERTQTGTTGLERSQREQKLARIMGSLSSLILNPLIMGIMMKAAKA